MQTRTLLLFGILFCVIAMASAGEGGGKKNGKDSKWKGMKKCQQDEINTEEMFRGFKECKKESEDKNTGQQEKESRRRRSPGGWGGGKGGKKWGAQMCAVVCALKKQRVLDEFSKFNETGCKEHIKKVYPEQFRNDAFEKAKECFKDHSSKFSMDDNCKGYMEFMKCCKDGHKGICGWKKGKGKGKGKPKESDYEAADEE